jgi:soluble lytic murein transglycosylase-like protein
VIFHKTANICLVISCAVAALTLGSCSSVDKTPIEQIMAVQYIVPVSKPGTRIEGLPAADDVVAVIDPTNPENFDPLQDQIANLKATAAGQNALASAASEAAESEGPTVELASAVDGKPAGLAYASPLLPSASDAMSAQMSAMGMEGNDPAASITVSAAPGTPRSSIDTLISKYSAMYGVPETLVHRVAKRESTYNPKALHRGNYGLMQIRYKTARGLGYDGKPSGLLDAETNLKYAVKYLRGAWIVAGKDETAADWLYRTGYYYDAKRKGLLDQIR